VAHQPRLHHELVLIGVYFNGTALGATVSGGGIQVVSVGVGGQLGSWNFNSGTADQSGSNNNLLLTGGATLASGGLYGSALSLNGAEGSYAIDSINNPAFDFGSNDFTIQIWVNSNDFGSGRPQTLIEKFGGSTGTGWTLTTTYEGTILFYAADGGIYLQSDPLSIPNGVWQEFVVERSGSAFSLYWDGNLAATWTYSGPISTCPNPLLVGARDAADGRDFTVNGLIDNVAIWNRALSTSEIASSWNNGLGDANNGAVEQGV
jgi:trimeric autotransporter adhesin